MTMATKKPKPCPFCRTRSKDPQVQISHGSLRYHVYCDECDTTGPEGITEADAIAAWNRALRKEKP